MAVPLRYSRSARPGSSAAAGGEGEETTSSLRREAGRCVLDGSGPPTTGTACWLSGPSARLLPIIPARAGPFPLPPRARVGYPEVDDRSRPDDGPTPLLS